MSDSLASWRDALDRLDEALALPADDDFARDSVILRFMLCYELAWKTFQRLLSESGVPTGSPRDAFKQAFKRGWIDNEQVWLDSIRERNLIVHTYNRTLAITLAADIRTFAPAMRESWRRASADAA